MVSERIMSIKSLLNDTARIFTISTSRDALSGVVNSSSFRLSTPARRWKLSQAQRIMSGEDGIERSYRIVVSSSVAINQSDFIYIQGIKHDELRAYKPGNMGLNHHIEIDARVLSAASS